MNESITVKCPECGHQFPLSEGIISNMRDTLSRELQSDITSREKELLTNKKLLTSEQNKLKQQNLKYFLHKTSLKSKLPMMLATFLKRLKMHKHSLLRVIQMLSFI